MPTWPSAMLAAGFTYASDTEPSSPKEGETWYDTGSNEAKVYDGVSWSKLTVTDHAELGSVSAGQHRSDSNIRSTVDGQVDADTVDGQHASDIQPPAVVQVSSRADTSGGFTTIGAVAFDWGSYDSLELHWTFNEAGDDYYATSSGRFVNQTTSTTLKSWSRNNGANWVHLSTTVSAPSSGDIIKFDHKCSNSDFTLTTFGAWIIAR